MSVGVESATWTALVDVVDERWRRSVLSGLPGSVEVPATSGGYDEISPLFPFQHGNPDDADMLAAARPFPTGDSASQFTPQDVRGGPSALGTGWMELRVTTTFAGTVNPGLIRTVEHKLDLEHWIYLPKDASLQLRSIYASAVAALWRRVHLGRDVFASLFDASDGIFWIDQGRVPTPGFTVEGDRGEFEVSLQKVPLFRRIMVRPPTIVEVPVAPNTHTILSPMTSPTDDQSATAFGTILADIAATPAAAGDTLILPTTGANGQKFLIGNRAARASGLYMVVQMAAGAKIGGLSSVEIWPQKSLQIVKDGTVGDEWRIIAAPSADSILMPLTTGVATPGGLGAWQNNLGADVVVDVVVAIGTPPTPPTSINVGVAAAAATDSVTLIDGAFVHAASGATLRTSTEDSGGGGEPSQIVPAGDYVTVTEASGDSTGGVLNLIVNYSFVA